jgi:hypothetical protein
MEISPIRVILRAFVSPGSGFLPSVFSVFSVANSRDCSESRETPGLPSPSEIN